MERKGSLERYHPPRHAEDDLSAAMGNMRVTDGYNNVGRGRGQHRWDNHSHSRGRGGFGGGYRGRGRGWYRGDDGYQEVNNGRYSPAANYSDNRGDGGYNDARYDLREELDHNRGYQRSKSDFDLRDKLNRRERRGDRDQYDDSRNHGDSRRNNGDTRRSSDDDHRRHDGDNRRRPDGDRNGRGGSRRNNVRGDNSRGGANNSGKLSRPKKNTENFNPCHEAPPMRVVVATPGLAKYDRQSTTRDVIIVSDLFGDPGDMTIYNKLLHEIQTSGVPEQQLWKLWHGDSHVIADDKRNWKEVCPTFSYVVERLRNYFDMDIKATRFNWYRNTSEWKPFHHDAAAMKPDKARTQNFTVAVSFGCERDAAFEHAETKTVVAMPQPNGTIYTFGRDVNIIWRHGILQVPPEQQREDGRISIIAWGWVPQTEL